MLRPLRGKETWAASLGLARRFPKVQLPTRGILVIRQPTDAPEREHNVAAKDLPFTDSLQSAT